MSLNPIAHFGKKKTKTPFDYAHVLDDFVAGIMAVGEHIRNHDIIVDAEEMYAQTRKAANLYELVARDEWPVETYLEDSDQAWWDFWIYVGEHIRGWWD